MACLLSPCVGTVFDQEISNGVTALAALLQRQQMHYTWPFALTHVTIDRKSTSWPKQSTF
jgi:hypothetical protein